MARKIFDMSRVNPYTILLALSTTAVYATMAVQRRYGSSLLMLMVFNSLLNIHTALAGKKDKSTNQNGTFNTNVIIQVSKQAISQASPM